MKQKKQSLFSAFSTLFVRLNQKTSWSILRVLSASGILSIFVLFFVFGMFSGVLTAHAASDSGTVNIGIEITGGGGPPPSTPPDYTVTVVDQYYAYFVGTATADTDVHLYITGDANPYVNEVVIRSDLSGDWIYKTGILNSGDYSSIAWEVDGVGTKGPDSADHPFTISLIAPDFGIDVNKCDYTFKLDGTDGFPGGKVHIEMDGPSGDFWEDEVYSDLDGNWEYESERLNEGNHVITAYSLDGYDTVGPSYVDEVTIDLQETPFDVDVNNSSEAELKNGRCAIPKGTVRLIVEGDNGYELRAKFDANSSGKWSYTTDVLLPGSYTATSYVIDDHDNEGPEYSRDFEVELGSPNFTLSGTCEILFTGTDGSPGELVHIVINGPDGYLLNVEVSADASGNWSYQTDALSPGTYTVYSYIVDRDGSSGPGSDEQVYSIPESCDDGEEPPPTEPPPTEPPPTEPPPTEPPPSIIIEFRDTLKEFIDDHPVAFSAVNVALMGIAIIPLFSQFASLDQIILALQGLLQNTYFLPLIFGGKRSRTGLVYNSQNGKPVALAKVRLFTSEGVSMGTKITDRTGRYSFDVPKGKYVIDVEREGYFFLANNTASPVYYAHSYTGQEIEGNEKKNVIDYDIPLFPEAYRQESDTKSSPFEIALDVFFVLGFSLSMLFFIVHASAWFFIPSLIFMFSGLLQRSYSRNIAHGTLEDEEGVRVAHASIEVYDRIKGRFIARTRTNVEGEYHLMLDPGVYSLTVIREGKDPWDKGEIITTEEKMISKLIKVPA